MLSRQHAGGEQSIIMADAGKARRDQQAVDAEKDGLASITQIRGLAMSRGKQIQTNAPGLASCTKRVP